MMQNRTVTQLAIMLLAMLIPSVAMAQKGKPTDKDLIGVWVMESYQFEGEKKSHVSDDYNQVKVYRANGEYACAEVIQFGKTETMIIPHEYGTYTMKNGKYTECGRKGALVMLDKTHFEGQWQNRHDRWRKVSDMPAKLVDYVVDKCKRRDDPKDIQALTKKHILSLPKK